MDSSHEKRKTNRLVLSQHESIVVNTGRINDYGAPEKVTAPPKLALLIGINKYDYATSLKGCVNDIKAVKDTLINKFGFANENIECLLSEEGTEPSARPTRANILAAFERLIERTQKNPGAVVTVHYSGHGSVQPNKDKPTGQNETIVPCDSGRLQRDGGQVAEDSSVPTSTDISDEELRDIFTRLAKQAVHVSAIFDSCHSESIMRAPEKKPLGVRIVPYDSRLGTIDPVKAVENAKNVEHEYLPTIENVVSVSACAYNNVAYEVEANSVPRGQLSYYWCDALQSRSDDKLMTYGDIFDLIAPNFDKEKQTPKIEGARTWQLFGTSKLDAQSFTHVIDQDDDEIQLNVGGAHLVTKGSEFGIYKPDVRSPDGSSQITATVMSVGSTTLWAKLNKKPDFDLKGYRAFETRRAGKQIAIHLPSNCPDHVKEGLKGYYQVVDEKDAELIVHELPPGDYTQFNVKLTPTKPALAVVDKSNTVVLPLDASDTKDAIASNLVKYARYQFHLNNNNTETTWKDQIEFVIYRGSKRSDVKDWKDEIRDDAGEFFEGDCIRFGVRQTSENKQLYFAIVGFDENGAIKQFYPLDKSETEPLKANEPLIAVPSLKGKDRYLLGIDKTIPRPPGTPVKCAFKLYVTANPTNYSFIEQDGYSETRKWGSEPIGIDDPNEWACKTIWCTLKHKV